MDNKEQNLTLLDLSGIAKNGFLDFIYKFRIYTNEQMRCTNEMNEMYK